MNPLSLLSLSSIPKIESSEFNGASNPSESMIHDKVHNNVTTRTKTFEMVYSKKLVNVPDAIAI